MHYRSEAVPCVCVGRRGGGRGDGLMSTTDMHEMHDACMGMTAWSPYLPTCGPYLCTF